MVSDAISSLQEWNTQYTYNCMTEQYESNKINRRLRNIENKIFKHQDQFFKSRVRLLHQGFGYFEKLKQREGGMSDAKTQKLPIHS